MIQCQHCEHPNHDGSLFCERCGKRLTAPSPAENRFCTSCGEPNPITARFCSRCGNLQQPSGAASAPASALPLAVAPPRPHRTALWLRRSIWLLLFGLLGAGLGSGYAYLSPLIEAYLVNSPQRIAAAGDLAEELVLAQYPELTNAERSVAVENLDGEYFYVVDFITDESLTPRGLRLLVDRYLSGVRPYEYVAFDDPEIIAAPPVDEPAPQVQALLSPAVSTFTINPRITEFDLFAAWDDASWERSSGVEVTPDEELELSSPPQFGASLTRRRELRGDTGFMINFRYHPETVFVFALETGSPGEADYKSFGLRFSDGLVTNNDWLANQQLAASALRGNLTLEPNHWYTLLAAVDPDRGGLIVIWDRDNSAYSLQYMRTLIAPIFRSFLAHPGRRRLGTIAAG